MLSIVALAIGPIAFPLVKRHPQFLCGMDGFVFVSILGLSLLHLMPAAIEHAGWWTLLAAFAGILGPFLFGRKLHHSGQRKVHNVFLLIAVAGLALHAMIDGAAIFHGTHETVEELQFGGLVAAVLIHRVPMSLLVWWSLQPRMGTRIAAIALGTLGAATVVGYLLGGAIAITPTAMGYLVAFVAGSLAHVVGHDTASELIPRHCHDRWHATYSAVGGTFAAIGLFYFGHLHEFEPAWGRFSALFVAAAPALLVGFTLGGLMEAGLGNAVLERLRGTTRVGSALRGVIFGTPIPICSCGVETVYEAVCKRGIPLAAAVAFLLAAPAITMDSLALSVELLGIPLTLARLAMTVVVALCVALLLSYLGPENQAGAGAHDDTSTPEKRSLAENARESLRQGWVEQIDHVAPWVVLGLSVVAIGWPLVEAGSFGGLPAGVDVIVLTLLSAPFYLNASAMTVVGASLLAGGASAGAVLSMLVASPSLNLAVLVLVKKLHGARAMWALLGGGLAATIGLGLLCNVVLPAGLDSTSAKLSTDILLAAHSSTEKGAAAVLAFLFLLSYFRMGPRGMLLQLLPAGHHHMHDHGHAGHAHAHGDDAHAEHGHH